MRNCIYGWVGVGWWNNNRRIISKYLTPFLHRSPIIIDLERSEANAELSALLSFFVCISPPPADFAALGVLSVKRKLTFLLGPQIRPVLSAGRFLGECGNAVILRDEGSPPPLLPSTTTTPHVPPSHSSECGQEGAGCCACVKCLYTCLRQRWTTQRPNPRALLCWWMWKHADAPNSPERGQWHPPPPHPSASTPFLALILTAA